MSPTTWIAMWAGVALLLSVAIVHKVVRSKLIRRDSGFYYLLVVPIITASITAAALIPVYFFSVTKCKHGQVVSVGGCDRHGVCGVELANKETALIRYPVLGQNVDFQCTYKWSF